MQQKPRWIAWLEQRIWRDPDRRWLFGITIRSVTFADHRSGWQALQIIWGCGPLRGVFYPVKWPTPYSEPVRILSLREVLEQNHPRWEEDDDEEEEAQDRRYRRAKTRAIIAELDAREASSNSLTPKDQ